MKEQICTVVSKEELVAYADGDLSPDRADQIEAHIADCQICRTMRDALELWRSSDLAAAAFGHEVVEHYANAARVELAAFDAAVTDWEMFRGFERL